MKRLPTRVHEIAAVQDTAPAPDAAGVDGIVGYHVPRTEWAAPADSAGAAPADLSAPATDMPVPTSPASLAGQAAGPMAVFSADAGIGAYDDPTPDANLGADTSVSGVSAGLAHQTTDSVAAFIADAASSSSLEDAADLTIDLDPVGSSTAPVVLTSLANSTADFFAAFSFGSAAAQAPQGIPYAGLDAAASAGGGVAFTSGPFAAAASAPAPPISASLANPPADFFTTPITESAIGGDGATAAQVQQALDDSGLNVNGSGIRVGVLSDSFNDLGGAAADEADGALPPAADIDVIKDLASGGTDEGRAMMQIIHDIAPGADLAFYTAFDSEQDFANGILALAAAGCKVIVDDVAYFDEPFFQNGVVAQAIQTVEAEGVTYVTAAGNDAGNAYQAVWTPISGTYDGKTLTDAESFGGSSVQTVAINTEGTRYDVPLLLEWNQAYGAATSDLEILVFNSSGRLVGTATNASNGEPSNPWVEYDFTRSGTYYVAIENLSGPNPGLIKEITEGDGLPATISGANVGSVYGHAMTPGAISAGAVSVADTPAFGVNPAVSESFSSSGAGTELLFANNGTALSSPDLLSPVAVSGVDDVYTSVPGGLSDFYGTSAASASLAGAAALILSADPNLTPAEVEQLMEETALPMANAAVSGAGLVQIDPAVKDVESGIVESKITVVGTASDAVQGGAAVAILTAAPTIADFGQTNFESATIAVTNSSGNAVAGDQLYVNGVQNGSIGNGVTASWNATADTLTLNGIATIAIYETLLGEVTYQDTGTDTSTVGHPQRAITWTVFDGTTNFDTTSQVTIDRPPVANNDVASDVAGSTIAMTAATGVLSIDSDLDGDKLTVTGVSDAASGAGSVGNSLAGLYGHLTLNADGSYSYVASNLSAISSAPTGSHLQDIFTYTVSDGNGATSAAELTITLDRPPVVTVANVDLTTGHPSVAASSLFTASDPDGNQITTYAFMDTGPGYFVLNGVEQPNDQEIDVTSAQFSQLTYQSVAQTTDTLQVRVNDGTLWSNWENFTVTSPSTSASTVIQVDGSTSLTEVGNNYFLVDSSGHGPALQYNGADVVAGEFGYWVPIGAVQTASGGYDIAWEFPGANEYTVWTTDSNGNESSSDGVLSGTSPALESLELVFNQDLNGAGLTLIQTDTNSYGSTSLTEVGNNYFLVDSSGPGPALKYNGADVVAGEFGYWVPIGAVQTASGYDIAWEFPGANEYTVWTTDSNGNESSSDGVLSGTSPALESLELVFNQDLNGDGYIDTPATVINVTGDVLLSLNPLKQAATIGTGATLELAGADSGSVTFSGSTGTLILDHSSAFSGEVFDFTGNGSASGSDVIDLKDIAFGSGTTDSYIGTTADGTLTVSDAHGDTASIPLSGDYINSTFSISSDQNGGTDVVDPAVARSLVGGTFLFGESDSTGNDTVSVSPQDGGSGYVGSFTVDTVNTANGQESVGWQFNLDPNSITQTITQSYNVTVSEAQPNGTNNSTETQSLAVTVGGPGNDTFVFHPGMGANVIANATSSDTIELDGFSSVPSTNQLQTLLTEAQTGQLQSLFETANGGHDTVINLGNHDSITLASVQISALHASNFIIH